MAQYGRHANQTPKIRQQKAAYRLKPLNKTPSKSRQTHKGISYSAHRIRFTAVSASIIFKTIILVAVLLVATTAIVYKITDAVVWAFLTMIAGYAALSSAPEKKEK